MDINKQVFIVTGASSGLGAATARALVQAGASVVLADLNQAQGEQLAQELGAATRFVTVNVTSESDGKKAIQTAQETFGGLNGLVNCAGIVLGERVVGREQPHALASFQRTIEVNLIGTFNMLRLSAEAMAKNIQNAEGERGVIINTASVAAFDGQIGQAAYAASKAGVAGMTLPVARELARFGIRCMTIAPGLFETPMLLGMTEEVKASLGAQVPFPPRLGRPVEYAELVLAILRNPMLNGETIRLDGAIRLAPK